jgi:hypothetical protein
MPLNVRIKDPRAHQQATVQLGGILIFGTGRQTILNRKLAGTPRIAEALNFLVFFGFLSGASRCFQ